MNPTLDTIFRRRSVRKYTDQPVEPEKLDLLLKAAMAAPSAMNCKPWEFVVVTDPEKLAQFRKRLIFGNRNAPAAIVVCGNPSLSSNPVARLFWVQDCSLAGENILIAAAGLGLGTVWVGVHPVAEFVRVVREVAELPKRVTPLGLIYVGYPAEEKPARTQYDAGRVHMETYGKKKAS
ncbi:MAG: nitroreductase family protein [Chloroflexi bacterium]|nr:nitroreductase family protein [Chloroflexota bacterium]